MGPLRGVLFFYMPNRRRKHTRKGSLWHRRSAIVLFFAGAIFALAATIVLFRPFSPLSDISAIGGVGKLVPLSIQEYAHKFPEQFYKLVYPYSIVPGGIGNADDAKRATLSDALVRTHYRNLDLAKLKPMNLAENRLAYVSYRMGDKVFWTAKRICLFKGERMLTDGTNLVRARCGNLVSDTPEPIAPFGGPSEEVLNSPHIQSISPGTPDERDGPEEPSPARPGQPGHPSSPTLTPSTLIAVVPDSPTDLFTDGFIPQGLPYRGSAVVSGPVPVASTEGSTPATPLTPPVTPPNNGGTTSPVVAPPVLVIPPVAPPTTAPGGLLPPTVLPPRTILGAPNFPTLPKTPHRGNPSVTPPLVLPPDTPPIGPVTPPPPSPPPVSSVPETSTWLLVGAGMCCLGWRAFMTRRGKPVRTQI